MSDRSSPAPTSRPKQPFVGLTISWDGDNVCPGPTPPQRAFRDARRWSGQRRPAPATPEFDTLTAPQRHGISFLTLVIMGTLVVPILAFTAGGGTSGAPELEAASQVAAPSGSTLLVAPPPVTLVLLGVALVAGAVMRRVRKHALTDA